MLIISTLLSDRSRTGMIDALSLSRERRHVRSTAPLLAWTYHTTPSFGPDRSLLEGWKIGISERLCALAPMSSAQGLGRRPTRQPYIIPASQQLSAAHEATRPTIWPSSHNR